MAHDSRTVTCSTSLGRYVSELGFFFISVLNAQGQSTILTSAKSERHRDFSVSNFLFVFYIYSGPETKK